MTRTQPIARRRRTEPDGTMLRQVDALRRPANYLSASQIYLLFVTGSIHDGTEPLRELMRDQRQRHHAWIRAHGEDLPEIRNRRWPGSTVDDDGGTR